MKTYQVYGGDSSPHEVSAPKMVAVVFSIILAVSFVGLVYATSDAQEPTSVEQAQE